MTQLSESDTQPFLIETQGLVKAYGILPVLRQLNLGIGRG
jgi:hypothetical protein